MSCAASVPAPRELSDPRSDVEDGRDIEVAGRDETSGQPVLKHPDCRAAVTERELVAVGDVAAEEVDPLGDDTAGGRIDGKPERDYPS